MVLMVIVIALFLLSLWGAYKIEFLELFDSILGKIFTVLLSILISGVIALIGAAIISWGTVAISGGWDTDNPQEEETKEVYNVQYDKDTNLMYTTVVVGDKIGMMPTTYTTDEIKYVDIATGEIEEISEDRATILLDDTVDKPTLTLYKLYPKNEWVDKYIGTYKEVGVFRIPEGEYK